MSACYPRWTLRRRHLKHAFLIPILAWLSWTAPVAGQQFDNGRADFVVDINNITIPYRVFGIYVLPNETVVLEPSTVVTVAASIGNVDPTSGGQWQWRAPGNSGLQTLTLTSDTDSIKLNVFVMRKTAEVRNGMLDHYRIGDYPKSAYRGRRDG